MKLDIEELLKRFRSDPSPRVKRAVLSRYAERYGGARETAGAVPFWRRSVPLYVVTAVLIFVAGLSFAGGRTLSRRGEDAGNASTIMQDTLIGGVPEQHWYYAPSDLL
jgi:hypothetical protein